MNTGRFTLQQVTLLREQFDVEFYLQNCPTDLLFADIIIEAWARNRNAFSDCIAAVRTAVKQYKINPAFFDKLFKQHEALKQYHEVIDG